MGQSPNWEKADVMKHLEQSGSAEPGLQVFLSEDVPNSEVETLAHEIVKTAGGASIGPVSRIAKSFAVHGDVSMLRKIAGDSRVKSILPTAVDDILPKPRHDS
ncbi:hypothetical protein IHQ71_29215 (plasmid) [Rhizobium sp. TH2]|uniref:hypothetical protein n=1 Tax=Rhizobium sp. TH2 TaxID=2775403 RepID=UPI0021581A6B|nr:hypothetical protein [Rhizobium sp. TH2]UVC12308.1 hypothetical protein IHQ71_29215 [Rhizobium sp. TH2]